MQPLCVVARQLTPAQDQTTLVFPFTVPQGTREVSVFMGYDPVEHPDEDAAIAIIRAARQRDGYPDTLEAARSHLPLNNLVTLSLDDPEGYLGNAHRKQSPQWLRFDGHTAPSGFAVRPVRSGEWRLCVHIHALVTPTCALRCVVLGGESL